MPGHENPELPGSLWPSQSRSPARFQRRSVVARGCGARRTLGSGYGEWGARGRRHESSATGINGQAPPGGWRRPGGVTGREGQRAVARLSYRVSGRRGSRGRSTVATSPIWHCCSRASWRSAPRPGSVVAHTPCGKQQVGPVVAVGAVCAVPLGHDIEARYPRKLIEQATDVFRQCDPDFRFAETPLEIVADRSWLLLRGRRDLAGGYHVVLQHGFLDGEPGRSACAAIYRAGECPEVGAIASAMLLDQTGALSFERPLPEPDDSSR